MLAANGILNVHKPTGISSARVVARVKRLLPQKAKIGHAGTLDPFASGVLLLLIGRATKLCETLMNEPKEYRATVKLGATTETDDPESPEIPTLNAVPCSQEIVEAAAARFVGLIQQRPPAFSAIKVNGRRAYALSRKGEQVSLPARPVQVYALKVLEYSWPLAVIEVKCGRGTYIRSLARDIGEALGVGGYLTALQRTRVGRFDISDAVTLERLESEGLTRFL